MQRLLKTLPLHDAAVRKMILCEDGRHVASTGSDGAVRVRLNFLHLTYYLLSLLACSFGTRKPEQNASIGNICTVVGGCLESVPPIWPRAMEYSTLWVQTM
jgi:hypothetical protein